MSNPQKHKWQGLLFGLQAQRRLLERDALQLGGALSIGTQYVSSQHANAQRVLLAPEMRSLLALINHQERCNSHAQLSVSLLPTRSFRMVAGESSNGEHSTNRM